MSGSNALHANKKNGQSGTRVTALHKIFTCQRIACGIGAFLTSVGRKFMMQALEILVDDATTRQPTERLHLLKIELSAVKR